MFILLARIMPQATTCFQTIIEENTHIWHRRLVFKGWRTLQHTKMVRGLPRKASSKICTDWMVGKQHSDAFPKRSLWRATQRLQLVHADICGPIKPPSNLKSLKLLLSSRISKILLRKRLEILFVVYAQTRVESLPLTSSTTFVKLMVSVDNLLHPTLPNKMVQLNIVRSIL